MADDTRHERARFTAVPRTRRPARAGDATLRWPVLRNNLRCGAIWRLQPSRRLRVRRDCRKRIFVIRSGMQQLGYVEGRNVIIEWRYADALYPRAVELATELV